MQDKEPEEVKEPVRSPIITPGDPERWPLLEMVSQTCNFPLQPADQQAIVEMDSILDVLDEDAAGLAAIQIGVPHRIFLLRNIRDEKLDKYAANNVYINPTILSKSRAVSKSNESCLSLPGMGAVIPRPKEVVLQYFDLHGDIKEETFQGFWARAVMHEMDHLNGVLITSHLEKQLAKQPSRTPFGMKVTPHNKKVVARRRATKKRAKVFKKHAKAIGR